MTTFLLALLVGFLVGIAAGFVGACYVFRWWLSSESLEKMAATARKEAR